MKCEPHDYYLDRAEQEDIWTEKEEKKRAEEQYAAEHYMDEEED